MLLQGWLMRKISRRNCSAATSREGAGRLASACQFELKLLWGQVTNNYLTGLLPRLLLRDLLAGLLDALLDTDLHAAIWTKQVGMR